MARTTVTPGVRVRGLVRRFGDRAVLDGIDLDIASGEFVVLLGASGTGKSTLLRILAGLDHDIEGTATVPAARAVVFQEPRLLPWRTVWRNVALGLPGGRVARRTRAAEALAEVGLADHAGAWPVTLSGGEAQRVALARALVREPGLLLLDEPFGALDALTRLKMHELLADLYERHEPAVLLVTHDVDEAILLAQRVLVLGEGQLVADLPIDLPPAGRRDHPAFAELRRELLSHLGVDPSR